MLILLRILYDFYKYQNALRADSVHATYLVYGTKDTSQPDVGLEMGSSQPEPLTEQVATTTMTLVNEENLNGWYKSPSAFAKLTWGQDVLLKYSKVTAIHVYSLAPSPKSDHVLLADVAKSISDYATNEDSAVLCKRYGTIYSPHSRWRDLKNRASAPTTTSAPSKQAAATAKQIPVVSKSEPSSAPVKNESPPAAASGGAAVKQETPSSSATKGKPAPPKGRSGGIMQSFAKAAAQPPKQKPIVKKEEEDTKMTMSDDGEADDDDMPVPKKTAAETASLRQAKRKRDEDLRRMMEEDEEEEQEEEEKEPEDEEMEEPEPEPEPEPVKEEKKEPEEVISASDDGRRRGKRRVMKKKRILDDQGYMGTWLYRMLRLFDITNRRCSHNSRGGLGIFLRRRHTCAHKERNAELYPIIIS